jgi:glycerol-3-phosphate dehydrogenase
MSRGAHLVLDSITDENAILLTSNADGRVFFVMPLGDRSLVGTTETDHPDGLDTVSATVEDVAYLLREVRDRWRGCVRDRDDVHRAFAGVRPLAKGWGGLGQTSREEKILNEDGLFSVVGGKYTTYRAVSERVLDRVLKYEERSAGRCLTAERPLTSGTWGNRQEATSTAERYLSAGHNLDVGDAKRLGPRYGSRFVEFARKSVSHHGVFRDGDLVVRQAEVVHAMDREKARRLDDVIFRRLGLWPDRDRSRRVSDVVAAWMATEAGWDSAQTESEVDRFLSLLNEEEQIIEAALSL